MRKLFLIVLVSLLVSATVVFAQDIDTANPEWMSYWKALNAYFKWSGKFFTDEQFEIYLERFNDDYNVKRRNEFQWKPFLKEQTDKYKEKVEASNLKKLYFEDFTGEVGDYDFEKQGFWTRVDSITGKTNYALYFYNVYTENTGFYAGTNQDAIRAVAYDFPTITILPNGLPNGYFFKMPPAEAEKLVNYFSNRSSRNVYVRIYYYIDDKNTKEINYTSFIKANPTSYALPVQVFAVQIRYYSDKKLITDEVTDIKLMN